MTICTLTRLWINLTATGEAISGASGRERAQAFETAGEIRQYANGRRRAISVIGEAGTMSFTLVSLDLTTKDKLRGWAGQAVQVRDHRGQKWFGVFFSLSVGEYMRPDLYSASFTLNTTSATEGV